MNTFRTGWYVIYTKPRHEKKVHNRLTELSIQSFLPTRKTLRTWHDRKKYVDEPLFPSYIFTYLNDLQHYYEAIDAEGSLYYVRSGKEVARVAEAVVNNLRLVTDKAGELEVSVTNFRPGQKLVISRGALTGLSCEIIQVDGKQKVLVRVDLLQRNILMSFSPDYLMAI